MVRMLRGSSVVSVSAARVAAVVVVVVLAVGLGSPLAALGLPLAFTELLSFASDGSQVTVDPSAPAISGDGGFVAFSANGPLLRHRTTSPTSRSTCATFPTGLLSS